MSHKKFIQDTFLIAISQILVNFSGFILLPIITKTLGPENYGIWSVITVTVSLLSPFALLGLSSGTIRFLSAEKEISTIRDDFYSVVLFVMSTGLLLSSCVFVFSEKIAESILSDSNSVVLVKISAGLILLSALSQITTIYFRIFHQTKMYSIFQIFQGVGKLLFIYLFLNLGYGLVGAAIGAVLAQSILVIISLSMVVRQIGFSFPRFTRFKDYISFSLPLSLNPMLRWVSESSDRYLIAYFLSSTYVGIYSAPYAIGNLIQMLVMPIQMTLFPEVSRLYDEGKVDDIKLYFNYSLKFFLILALPSVFGLAALAKPILLILTTSQFIAGAPIIPIIAFAGLLIGIFQIYINITLLFKKSHLNFYLFLIPGVVNVCLNMIFIPLFGIIGAAIATVFSYAVMLSFCLMITRHLFRFPVDLLSYIKMLIASIMMYLILSLNLPSTTLELARSIFLGAIIYFMLVYFLKTFNEKEMKFIKKTVLPKFGRFW